MGNKLRIAIIVTAILSLSLSIFLMFQLKYVMEGSYSISKAVSEGSPAMVAGEATPDFEIPVAPRRAPREPVEVTQPIPSSGQATPDEPRNQDGKTAPKPKGDRVAYLTFDDGPSLNTLKVLEILKQNDVKATFFVTGNNKTGSSDIYRRIAEEGHSIGNHTYSHSYKDVYASADSFLEDFNRLQNYIQEVTGVKPNIMRFPGGSNNTVCRHYGGQSVVNEVISRVKDEGYQYFDWNVSSTDGSESPVPKETIINSVLRGAANKKKAIILFHDSETKVTTVEAIQEIIPRLKEMGFRFETLSKGSFTYQFRK